MDTGVLEGQKGVTKTTASLEVKKKGASDIEKKKKKLGGGRYIKIAKKGGNRQK